MVASLCMVLRWHVYDDENPGNTDNNMNTIQIKLLNQTSRYVSLLSLAILTTCLTLICFAIPIFRTTILFAITSIDGMINVSCLYCVGLRNICNCLLRPRSKKDTEMQDIIPKYQSVEESGSESTKAVGTLD